MFNWQADSSNEKENCIFSNFLIDVYVWVFLKWYFKGPHSHTVSLLSQTFSVWAYIL